jgi:hypothetical protein
MSCDFGKSFLEDFKESETAKAYFGVISRIKEELG